MRILLIPLVLLGALGCSASPAAKAPAAPPAPSPPRQWVVISAEEAPHVFAQCSRLAPREKDGPFWAPSVAQIEELERGLPAYLRKQGHAKHAAELGTYLRQYVGFVRAGRKLIYLNAFSAEMEETLTRVCREMPERSGKPRCSPDAWRREAMYVCDGGDSLWGLEYDPASKTFDHLDFNGVA